MGLTDGRGLLLGLALASSLACGSNSEGDGTGDGGVAPDGASEPGAGAAPSETPVFSVEGRGESSETAATLRVEEGESPVLLTIRGADAQGSLILFYVNFVGTEDVVGAHQLEVGAPASALAPGADVSAVGMVDGQAYYSLGGHLDLSVLSERWVDGTFEVSMALDDGGGPPPGVPIESIDEALSLSGTFHNSWMVTCTSHLVGFTGGHYVTDSPYCNNLTF